MNMEIYAISKHWFYYYYNPITETSQWLQSDIRPHLEGQSSLHLMLLSNHNCHLVTTYSYDYGPLTRLKQEDSKSQASLGTEHGPDRPGNLISFYIKHKFLNNNSLPFLNLGLGNLFK